MKEKIIVFIIGVLVGTILATGGFFIYNKVNSSNSTQGQIQQVNGERPEMNRKQPPELPNGEKPSGERPDKSSENFTENNAQKSETTTTENN